MSFPSQILEHFCPFFARIGQMGPHLPRLILILLTIPPLTPVLYSAVTHPFRGYVRTQNNPNPTQQHPFSWPELESGQNELQSGQPGPHLGNMFKKWTKVGKNIFLLKNAVELELVETAHDPTCNSQF